MKHARVFAPGANVPLKVAAPKSRLERYAEALAKRFDRTAVNSELHLRNSKPFVTKEPQGRRLRQSLVVRDLYRSLKTHTRDPIALKQDVITPTSTRASIGEVIVIRRGLNKLLLYDGMKLGATSESPPASRCIRRRSANSRSSSSGATRGGTRRSRPGRRTQKPVPPGPATRSARAGWAFPRPASASTARRMPPRSATRLARLHPDADPARPSGSSPGRHRHAGLHRLQ